VTGDHESLSHPQPFTLSWILHPLAAADFFRDHWETQPLFVGREDPDYFMDLPGLDAVDELITATTSGRVRWINDGHMVRTDARGNLSERPIRLDANGIPDLQDVFRAYDSGYTVVVNQLHRRSATVALMCRSLEVSLHHPVGVN
jgi:bifunctional lysine-specific demethylase and histidyl-hydroxylase NO66